MKQSIFKKKLSVLLTAVMFFTICIPTYAAEPDNEPAQVSEGQAEETQNDISGVVEDDAVVDNQLVVVTNDSEAVKSTVDEKEEDTVVDETDTGDSSMVVVETTDNLADKMEEYEADPSVEYVQPNFVYSLHDDGEYEAADNDYSTQATTNDTNRGDQWYLGGSSNVTGAWDISMTYKLVKVAVIDSGVQIDHPDLSANINKSLSYDFVNKSTLTGDLNGHGTHVAGIIAGVANNGIGIAGVSYNAELLCYRVTYKDKDNYEVTSTSYLVSAINKALSDGAKVINISLGGYNNDTALHDAIKKATNAGVIVICAAGNDGDNALGSYTTYPADYDEAVSVTAVDSNNLRADFSNYNQYKDIAAPGVDILSTYKGGGYVYSNGTSMSAPFVSGVVSLMLAVNSKLSVSQIKSILYSTARDLGVQGKDDYYGNGLINAKAAVSSAAKALYSDVNNSNWSYPYINFVTKRGIMTGYADGSFARVYNMTRGQFVTVLYRMQGSPSVSGIANKFPDVDSGLYYTNAVKWANSTGVVSGYNNGNFGPNDSVTRQELATMLFRYAGYRGLTTTQRASLSRFSDAGMVTNFATDAMKWAVSLGIITGDGGKLNPQGTASREVCATMITRFVESYGL